MDSLDPSHEPAWRENHEKNNHDAGDDGDHCDAGDDGDVSDDEEHRKMLMMIKNPTEKVNVEDI